MNPASSIFAIITALLEDMHSIAIEGQAPGISGPEVRALVAVLHHGVVTIGERLDDVKRALRQNG